MKAAIHKKYGPPEVIEITELEKPVPQKHEVLIRVKASTVNRTDCANLRAKPFIMRFVVGLLNPSKPIPGTDFAGEIVAVGKDVKSFKVGDKVFGFDDTGLSSKAEYMVFAADNAITTLPNNIGYEEAAASIEGAHYAYNMINKVVLQTGETALVNGATGAIGSAAVQLLTYYGIKVSATCELKHFDLIKSLGASELIDYTKEDFTQSDNQYHYVFDTVGKSTFGKCKPILLPGGVYISSELGPFVQNLYLPVFTRFFGSKKVKFPLPQNRLRSVLLIKKLMQQGAFKPVIDQTYSLDDIADAYRYVETGQKIGNVVITIPAE